MSTEDHEAPALVKPYYLPGGAGGDSVVRRATTAELQELQAILFQAEASEFGTAGI